jgi:hypothetical protein
MESKMREQAQSGATASDGRRRRAYFLLVALEAAGAAVILWHGLPLYRRMLSAEVEFQQADTRIVIWAVIGIVLIQAAYWASTLKVFPLLSVPRHVLAGQAALFLARLNFVFVSSLFAVVVFSKQVDLEFVAWRATTLVAVLFSMFCFSLELERLSKRLGRE